METLHTTRVTADQIDHLGHMNVMYYGQHAHTAARTLTESLGWTADGPTVLFQRDRYVRHHHEQLLDAPLEVRGGVLDATEERVRLYEELANSDSGDIAATFVITLEPVDRRTRRPAALSASALDALSGHRVPLPEHGRSRSISVEDDPTADAPGMQLLTERDLAMREVRTITDREVDSYGCPGAGLVAELVWGGTELPGREFEPFHETPDVRIGWATMETRGTWARPPSPGDRVQSYGGEIEIASKALHSRNWVYDVDTGDLVCVFSVVTLAFDVDARRAVVIPDDLRRRMSARLHPDLHHEAG